MTRNTVLDRIQALADSLRRHPERAAETITRFIRANERLLGGTNPELAGTLGSDPDERVASALLIQECLSVSAALMRAWLTQDATGIMSAAIRLGALSATAGHAPRVLAHERAGRGRKEGSLSQIIAAHGSIDERDRRRKRARALWDERRPALGGRGDSACAQRVAAALAREGIVRCDDGQPLDPMTIKRWCLG